MSGENSISLAQLLDEVKGSLKRAMPTSHWIKAEIMEMQVNQRGHAYLELIEKAPGEGPILARARATIWASRFGMLRAYFEASTSTQLKSGLQVLCKGSVEFHPQYGFSINITDIDPAYTLGDLSRKKLEVIRRLREEGVFDMNRELPFPLLARKVAVISSETAAGYGDFMDSLRENKQGYALETKLFPAIMQGGEAPDSIRRALDQIHADPQAFEAVVIIRGGGSKADLECYNDYELAYYITQFPMPVLSGIGHERDESVVDLVVWKALKTPTAVAEYLLDLFLALEFRLTAQEDRLRKAVEQGVHAQSLLLERQAGDLVHLSRALLERQKASLASSEDALKRECRMFFQGQKDRLHLLESRNRLVHPHQVLQRGFSITTYQGKALRTPKDLPLDALLETRLEEGIVESIVTKTKAPHGKR